MPYYRRLLRHKFVQRTLGILAAEYLRLVWKTSRYRFEPADIYERALAQQPVIVTMWHGQHFMLPFIRQDNPAKVLISRHRDGEINAVAAERLGVGTIRGSGDVGGRFDLKGGVGAFRALLTALAEGCNVALTADVPKIARVAGAGVIKLGQFSGRPIYPVAIASSRRKVLNNWDRTTINLPFSRIAIAIAEPIRVPTHADDAAVEHYRKSLESALNAITMRAYEIADCEEGGFQRG